MLLKPPFGKACTHCGYCCSTEPCDLAQEFLGWATGPCIALEVQDGQSRCGLVRNPLGYLYSAQKQDGWVAARDQAPSGGAQLSADIAAALGAGLGCDAVDDEVSARWPGLVLWLAKKS